DSVDVSVDSAIPLVESPVEAPAVQADTISVEPADATVEAPAVQIE
ncbi:MAG: hypothetical protein GX811_11175, partial [Lentisphaerae bacterium]|nr:hypothetical protein [Lentisphaerota bacterium]